MPRNIRTRRLTFRGFSLLELLAAVTIIAILAVIILPRMGRYGASTKKNACAVNKGNIEVQIELWYRNRGTWPTTTLSDIGADRAYFPEALPTCPVDGSTYQMDSNTHRVIGHSH